MGVTKGPLVTLWRQRRVRTCPEYLDTSSTDLRPPQGPSRALGHETFRSCARAIPWGLSSLVVHCLFVLTSASTAGAVCSTSAMRSGMAYYLLQFDTEKFFSPVGTIGTAWTASGWTAAAYEQTTTSAAASLPLDVFYAQMPNFGAINLVSHGAAGGAGSVAMTIGRIAKMNSTAYMSGPPFDDWVRGIDFGPSSVDSPSGIKFGIKLYPSGIAKLPVRSDAFIVGVYCTSDQASSYWPGAGYWGFVGEACSAPQYVNKFWFRMGCGDEDCVEPNAGDAFEGGCHGTGVGGVLRTGSEEWSLNCVRGCEAWPTYLSAYGAFEDTVYCQYVTDGLESRLILHGYPTLGDYPNNGLALDTVTVAPGASRTVLTAMQVPSQMFLYEWQEIAALRTRDRSEAFALATGPVGGALMSTRRWKAKRRFLMNGQNPRILGAVRLRAIARSVRISLCTLPAIRSQTQSGRSCRATHRDGVYELSLRLMRRRPPVERQSIPYFVPTTIEPLVRAHIVWPSVSGESRT